MQYLYFNPVLQRLVFTLVIQNFSRLCFPAAVEEKGFFSSKRTSTIQDTHLTWLTLTARASESALLEYKLYTYCIRPCTLPPRLLKDCDGTSCASPIPSVTDVFPSPVFFNFVFICPQFVWAWHQLPPAAN